MQFTESGKIIRNIMGKDKNEELQSRRDFFKNAAKKALPILGAVAIASTPLKVIASSSTDCNAACVANCGYACTTCWTGCTGTCKSCSNGCASGCSGGCKNSCEGKCDFGCQGSCKGGCGWQAQYQI